VKKMIRENDYVILKKGDFMKIFQVKAKRQISIDKFKCYFDELIGKPYGFKYEIKNQQFCLLKENNMNEEVSTNSTEKIEIVKDNRNLLDNSDNQKLRHGDIEKLKSNEEMSGNKIIDYLIENSASFNQKTEYSQEKYIKKKEDKYLPIYQVLRPTIRNLCQYHTQGFNKKKMLNMRIDTLSQMLTYSNLAAFRNVMVLESCKGLLLAAVVERVAGRGTIINLSPNGSHISTREILDYMNFPEDYLKSLHHFPLERIDKVPEYIDELNRKISVAQDNQPYVEKQTQKLGVANVVNELLKNKDVDCLIIASKFRPSTILEKTINYLDSNRYFVIYSSIQEPLIECHSFLKQSQRAIHIELSDNFLREYQVLPERTHPKVMMDACSGYLLTGLTVSNK